ncbi:MAG: DUF3108 domain-containing protein [Ghiorsea sp.]|nr:DUF3108 domain-containing protein [Ghiorsea sp.]
MTKLKWYGLGVLCMLMSTQVTAATSDCFPFVGEKYKFDVGWEFVNAGTAEISITKQGVDGYRVYNFARTNGFLDLFKRVRDTLVSEGLCVDGKMQSTLFTTDQVERDYKATKHVKYLYKENKVEFTKNGKSKIFDVPAGHLNVIDAFYLTRMDPPSKGKPISIPVFDSEKKYDVTVKLLKRQRLKAPWGKWVDCLVIQPELKTEGVFTSVGTIKIWLTNDARRIPLKITAKLKIGRIVVRLTEYSKT